MMNNNFLTMPDVLKQQYKFSDYNLYITKNNGNYVYNTRSLSLVEFNETKLKEEFVDQLLKSGIITNKDTDEIEELKKEYDEREKFANCFHTIIALTLDCQCRCFYCYETHPKTYITDETKESLVQLIDAKAKSGNNISVVWYGGEPLLDFKSLMDLTERFKRVCKRHNVNYSAQMITNGYAFNDYIISLIDELEIKEVQITLDGLKEEHNKRRPVINDNDSFDKIVNNIAKIHNRTNTSVKIRINVDKKNLSQAYKLLDYLNDKKILNIDLTLGMLKEFGCEGICSKCNPSLMNMQEFADEYVKFKSYAKAKGFFKAYNKMKPIYKINSCTLDAPNAFVIGPDGDCYKCISQVGNKTYSIGNISTGFDENAHRQYSPFDYDDCVKCKYLPICKGGCLFRKEQNKSECEIWKYVTQDVVLSKTLI